MMGKPRIKSETSWTVTAKTFTEVLDILREWHRSGDYRFRSIDWSDDEHRYYIHGDRIEWIDEG